MTTVPRRAVSFRTAVFLAPLLFVAAGESAAPDHSDVSLDKAVGEARFSGRWKVVRFISSNGRPSSTPAKYQFVFSPGKLEWFNGDGKHLHTFKTSFEFSKNPPEFNLFRKVGTRDRHARGVFEFKDGLLHLYYIWDKPRPTKLERPDAGYVYTIQRIR